MIHEVTAMPQGDQGTRRNEADKRGQYSLALLPVGGSVQDTPTHIMSYTSYAFSAVGRTEDRASASPCWRLAGVETSEDTIDTPVGALCWQSLSRMAKFARLEVQLGLGSIWPMSLWMLTPVGFPRLLCRTERKLGEGDRRERSSVPFTVIVCTQ